MYRDNNFFMLSHHWVVLITKKQKKTFGAKVNCFLYFQLSLYLAKEIGLYCTNSKQMCFLKSATFQKKLFIAIVLADFKMISSQCPEYQYQIHIY